MKFDKSTFDSPGDAFRSLMMEGTYYTDADFPANVLRVIDKEDVSMNKKNGFMIHGQKFATHRKVFVKLAADETVTSIKIKVKYDPLDCRNASCLAYDHRGMPVTFETHNVKYANEPEPISFDEAVPYNAKYKNPIRMHSFTTTGRKIKHKPKPPQKDKTSHTNLDEKSFNAEAALKDGGKAPKRRPKSPSSYAKQQNYSKNNNKTFVRERTYREINQDE